MSHVLSEGYSFPNPVEAALSFILQQSSNKVLWDECQLIWDDQELIEKAPPNGVAVYGVQGKVVTADGHALSFYMRHRIDNGSTPKYRLRVSVETAIGASADQVDIRKEDLRDEEAMAYFTKTVQQLTEHVKSLGVQQTIRLILAPTPAVK
ncbi:hypothetical protein F4825DRAFT_452888 [Nemania diffusa]|nr:hypothetical protein F4825DRAFT_452888 [Nemania diffusa]